MVTLVSRVKVPTINTHALIDNALVVNKQIMYCQIYYNS